MNLYMELKPKVREQLKGHHISLILSLLFTSLAFTLVRDLMEQMIHQNIFLIISFVLSLVYVIVNDTVLFLFIKRIRGESFHTSDIKYAISKFPVLLIAGILISLIQMLISNVCLLLAILPPVFYVAMGALNALFVLWSALVAYGVYDGNNSVKELVLGSLKLMKANLAPLLRASVLYIIWFIVIQIALGVVLTTMLGSMDTSNLFVLFATASKKSTTALLSVSIVYILYYTVQFILLSSMYLYLANIYENDRRTYMPSGK